MSTKQLKFDNRIIWITVDEVYQEVDGALASRGFVGYWSLTKPSVAYGESVKNEDGRTLLFETDVAAQQAAERAAKAAIDPA